MSIRKAALPALALAVALGGAGFGTLEAAPALAQATSPAPQAPAPERHHFDPARHIEGRIAYLKAELKITPAQEADFNKLAQAMRDNAKERAATFEKSRADRDKPRSAVESLEARARFGQLRMQQTERLLAAFRPLYASLSPDQKKAADEMLGGHHHHHHWRG